MKTKPWAFIIVLLCTLLTAAGQLLLKKGANVLEFSVVGVATNYLVIIGLILYAFAAVMLIVALKYGELSVLYPIIATSFIWVSVLSMTFLGETISLFRWFGIFLIMLGVTCIGFGSVRP